LSQAEPRAEPLRRRPGRPRASRTDATPDTREEILRAAGNLFTTQGYAATGTREIAARVGIRQASLFHHFAHKDDILAELLDRTVAPALAAASWLDTADAPAEVRLYALARHDVANLCGSGHDLATLQLLPEARDGRFSPFWAKRAELRSRYEALIAEAAGGGRLIDLPVAFATDLVFGAVEATMTWYTDATPIVDNGVADGVAGVAVRGILARPPSTKALRRAANALVTRQPRHH
jgi:AcrR family transcriptional regulator